MKKVCAILLVLVLVFASVACNRAATLPLPKDEIKLVFSSGAGGWETLLTLRRDGSFEGEYHDSDIGTTGENYPNGTVHICTFSGTFSDIEKADEHTYTMQLAEIHTVQTDGEEWIEDGIRYIAAGPYGIDGGTEFRFYTPGITAGEVTPNDALLWIPFGYYEDSSSIVKEYLLVNVAEGNAFFNTSNV